MIQELFFITDLHELFHDVQTSEIFSDQKAFTDSVPKLKANEIAAAYQQHKKQPNFNLLAFVQAHFELPKEDKVNNIAPTEEAENYVNRLWNTLTKTTKKQYSTLIHLPQPFVVPGGRFREFFYWDSYFTMLGLQVSGRVDLIENMVDNFAYLIDNFGFIPNGNRTYFLSRSQPPFFALMVALLAEENGESSLPKYLPQLLKEHAFWMNGHENLTNSNNQNKRVVKMPNGEVLNRYWDEENTPRPEGYIQDLEIFHNAKGNTDQLYRNIRAACESGWDFSSRWFAEPNDVTTIKTIDLIPVDLNCLLYNLENTIAQAYKVLDKDKEFEYFIQFANKRAKAIDVYLWNEGECGFYDYDFVQNTPSKVLSMATAFPLFFNLCNAEKAELVLKIIEKDLLKVGGLLTTINTTSQQWDAPNGWAPLQWIGYKAAQNYGAKDLALTIGTNWIRNVERVFNTTGKMMEKYNVIDITLAAGGGEYPNQDGFGWTNGCYLKLKKLI